MSKKDVPWKEVTMPTQMHKDPEINALLLELVKKGYYAILGAQFKINPDGSPQDSQDMKSIMTCHGPNWWVGAHINLAVSSNEGLRKTLLSTALDGIISEMMENIAAKSKTSSDPFADLEIDPNKAN